MVSYFTPFGAYNTSDPASSPLGMQAEHYQFTTSWQAGACGAGCPNSGLGIRATPPPHGAQNAAFCISQSVRIAHRSRADEGNGNSGSTIASIDVCATSSARESARCAPYMAGMPPASRFRASSRPALLLRLQGGAGGSIHQSRLLRLRPYR